MESSANQIVADKKAFTLVELLVVISIIALLLAILLPALSRAREISRRTVCASQMRAFGVATGLYVNDFNYNTWQVIAHGAGAYYPGHTNYAIYMAQISLETKYFNHGLLLSQKYIETPEIFYCPSDQADMQYGERFTDYFKENGELRYEFTLAGIVRTSYIAKNFRNKATKLLGRGYSRAVGAWFDGLVDVENNKVNSMENSQMALLADRWTYSGGGVHLGDFWNVLYIDGHVDAYRDDATDTVADIGLFKSTAVSKAAAKYGSVANTLGWASGWLYFEGY